MADPVVTPQVLVVDDDVPVRRIVAMSLALEGVEVVEAGSVGEARNRLSEAIDGVVLDRQLPDGDGLDLLPVLERFRPHVSVVVHSTLDDGREPAWVVKVAKGDVDALVEALALGPSRPLAQRLAVVDLVEHEVGDVVAEWRELCVWDPMLPPDTAPPLATEVVCAVVDALGRPQPIGWGADPAVEGVIGAFVEQTGSVPVAIGQLVCLREALVRRISARIPPAELAETTARLHMALDRAIVLAAQQVGAE